MVVRFPLRAGVVGSVRPALRAGGLSAALLVAPAVFIEAHEASLPAGVVVEEVEEPSPASEAGLRPGDVLLTWEATVVSATGPEPARGGLQSPFDLGHAEREYGPRGPVTVEGKRDGVPLRMVVRMAGRIMKPDSWGLEARPWFNEADLHAYQRAKALVRDRSPAPGSRVDRDPDGTPGSSLKAGLAQWTELAQRLIDIDRRRATWLFLRAARTAAAGRERDAAAAAFESAITCAEALGEPSVQAVASEAAGMFWEQQADWTRAIKAYGNAVEAHRAQSPQGLGEAWGLARIAQATARRGDFASAESYTRRARTLREALAPRSLAAAESVVHSGLLATLRGDLSTADILFRQALAIQTQLAPGSLPLAGTLNNLGILELERGDLAAAEIHLLRGLEIMEELVGHGLPLATPLANLGQVAAQRGDLPRAEHHYRRSLAIFEKWSPRSPEIVSCLVSLGGLARQRADLAGAEAHFRQALALVEHLGLQGRMVADAVSGLGDVAADRGDRAAALVHYRQTLDTWERLAPAGVSLTDNLVRVGRLELESGHLEEARRHLVRANEIASRLAPRGLLTSETQLHLGDVLREDGDRTGAGACYERSLAIRHEQAPGSADEAEACYRLATLHRNQDPDRALGHYRCAMDALDAQRRTLGGTQEVAARFAAKHAAYYREALDQLVVQGRSEEAFHVLERYRARGLLALLAERDLVFSADVPEELDRERRQANTEYDRIQAEMAHAEGPAVEEKREALRRARQRQAEVRSRIRAESPRLATLQYPEPLDLSATRLALDPGTLLLSYSIGEEKSHVFAVGPGPDDFTVEELALTRRRLQDDVGRFREAVERGRGEKRLWSLAGGLSQALFGALAGPIARADRLLVIPDGPLHLLPFAALLDPARARPRYLVEAKPLHLAASATVFAELKKERRPRRPPRLVAFGDPDYSAARAAEADSSAPELRFARKIGLDLRPTPQTRKEVEDLGALFASNSRIYVGAEATEDRAKAVGTGASLLHFACHGLADGRSPLDSSLALSIPPEWQPDRDNGLLQAWEVFEQVRIDADLVTLSACGTALGEEMSGEGVLGLTRAFQYAGARSVVASLWSVNDAGTADLMARFYRHLRDGRSKDVALQMAQTEMIRSSSHPFRWAAFELVGDWR